MNRDEEFRQFVVAHRGALLRTATFLTSGDEHAAEDLVQTALMRVYVAWPRVRPETVEAYARKALTNALIDNRRRSITRFERSHAQVPDIGIEDQRPSAMESGAFVALAALPTRMRAAVVLRHLLDLSVTETADALNCSEGTVKSQTARGIAQLRDALARTGLHTGPPPVDLRHAADPVPATPLGGTDE